MLLKCPECELPVSDKAKDCPHCGYPMKSPDKNYRRPAKRRRLPNGFGQISEIKGQNLRRPFRAMVTVGRDERGKPICKLLKPEAYFETYNEAYAALIAYHKDPYDFSEDITMAELYAQWSAEHFRTVTSASRVRAIRSAWNYCKPLHDVTVKDVKARHVKMVAENPDIPPSIRAVVKTLLNMLFDYALEYEVVDHNPAREAIVKKAPSTGKPDGAHKTFTKEELAVLWQNINNSDYPEIDMVLIQCYSGWRPQELCNLRTADVNISTQTMLGGMKTAAGADRLVPIHSKILPLVKRRYLEALSDGREYLFGEMRYDRYRRVFQKIMAGLNLDASHRPHDCRVCFVTMAKKANVDEYAIKRIVGHVIPDLTERVYTKRDPEWLKFEVEKIK